MANRFILQTHRSAHLNGEFKVDDPGCLDEAGHAYFGRILHLLNREIKSADLTFVVTTFNVESLPIYGPKVVACILEDELSREPRYRNRVGAIFRCYPSLPSHLDGVRGFKPIHRLGASYKATRDFFQGGAGRIETVLSRLAGKPVAPVFEIPIGYYASADVEFVPFENREADAVFCGSISHLSKDSADGLMARFRPKSLERLQMKEAMEEVTRRFPEIRLNHSFTGSFLESAASSQSRYLTDMMSAKFCLVPRGGVPLTYRFYEAVRSGTIPIGETFPHSYEGAPFVRLNSWSDLPVVLHRLITSGHEEMQDLHQQAIAWWKEKVAEEVIADRMNEQLKTAGLILDENTEIGQDILESSTAILA